MNKLVFRLTLIMFSIICLTCATIVYFNEVTFEHRKLAQATANDAIDQLTADWKAATIARFFEETQPVTPQRIQELDEILQNTGPPRYCSMPLLIGSNSKMKNLHIESKIVYNVICRFDESPLSIIITVKVEPASTQIAGFRVHDLIQ